MSSIIPNYKYFETQENDEQVIMTIRRHWTVLMAPFVLGAGVLGLTLILAALASTQEFLNTGLAGLILVLVTSLIVLFTVLFSFVSWLVLYLNLIVLTTEHLVEIHQQGIFNRQVSELDLESIEDVTASVRGVFQTMLKYGTVFVQTAGELPNFNLTGIGNPNLIQQAIMEAKEKLIKGRLAKTGQPLNQPPKMA